jgi:hypothetical protein
MTSWQVKRFNRDGKTGVEGYTNEKGTGLVNKP